MYQMNNLLHVNITFNIHVIKKIYQMFRETT